MAISSSVAEPVPLSLMPGPSATLSRCAPAITTLSALPVFVSAITFSVERVSTCVVGLDVDRRPRRAVGDAVGELLAQLEAGVDRRDLGELAEGAEDRRPSRPGLALVEDDRRGRARLGGVLDLDGEVAGAALHQRDLAARRGRRSPRPRSRSSELGSGSAASSGRPRRARRSRRRCPSTPSWRSPRSLLDVGRRSGAVCSNTDGLVLDEDVEVERLRRDRASCSCRAWAT